MMAEDETGAHTVNRVSSPRAVRHAEVEIGRYITAQNLAPGSLIPNQVELARLCGVAPATVQRAIANLASRGVVRSISRRGTFVELRPEPAEMDSPSWGSVEAPIRPAKTPKTLNLGLVANLPPPVDQFQWTEGFWPYLLVRSIERTIAEEVGVVLHFTNLAPKYLVTLPMEEAMINLFQSPIDGVIFYAGHLDSDHEGFITAGAARGVPAVVVANRPIMTRVPLVYFDDIQAGYVAARHLIELGHQRLAYFSPFAATWVRHRHEGIQEAVTGTAGQVEFRGLLDDSITPPEDGHRHLEVAREYASQTLSEDLRGTAFICANDRAAFGLKSAAEARGWELSRDFALLGFDDLAMSREAGVTSVHPPIERMGREAVRLLISSLRGGSEPIASHVRIPPYLVPRASTRPLQLQ